MTQKTLSTADVQAGDSLPDLPIEITTTLVVAGALASRDFTTVHHDVAAAKASGMGDVFMNILTTNGLVGRYVTDWAGPDAVLRTLSIKLGAPNMPGDTMKMKGEVKAVDAEAGTVDLEVVGTNAWGPHVTAQVTVALAGAA